MPPVRLIIQVEGQNLGTITKARDELERFIKGAEAAGRVAHSTSGSLSQMVGGFGGIAKAAGGFALASAGVSSLSSAVTAGATAVLSFDTGMRKVNTLIAGNIPLQEQLRQELLQLPPALGSSAELAEGLYAALSAGIEPTKVVQFLATSAQAAKAGLTDMGVATDAMAKIMRAFGLETGQAQIAADTMFQTVNVGAGNFEQFSRAFAQVSPLAGTLKVSLNETAASLATLSFAFPSAAEAATGLRSLLEQLTQNAEKLRAVGINVTQVLATEGLTGAMTRLQAATGGNIESLQRLGFEGESLQAILGLSGAQAGTFAKALEDMQKKAGAAGAATKEMGKGFAASWDTFTNALDRFVNQSAPPVLAKGTELLNWLTAFTESSRQVAEAQGNLPGLWANMQTGLSGVSAVLGPVVAGFGSLVVSGVDAWAKNFAVGGTLAKEALGQMQLGIGSVSTTLGGWLNTVRQQGLPIVSAAAEAMGGLAGKLGDAATKAGEANTQTDALAKSLDILRGSVQAQGDSFDAHVQAYQRLADRAGDLQKAQEKARAELDAWVKKGKEQADFAHNLQMELADVASQATLVAGAFTKVGNTYTNIAAATPPVTLSAEALATAMKNLGITTKEEFARIATEGLAAFTALLTNGKTTTAELAQAWPKVREAAIAAYGKLPAEFAAIEARLKQQAASTGQAITQSYQSAMERSAAAGKAFADRFNAYLATIDIQGRLVREVEGFATDVNGRLVPSVESGMTDMFGRVTQAGRQAMGAIHDVSAEAFAGIERQAQRTAETVTTRLAGMANFIEKRLGQWAGFSTAFAGTEAEIIEQIRGFEENIRSLREPGLHQTIPGYVEFQIGEYNKAITALYQKLEALRQQNDQAQRTAQGGSGGSTTTGDGGSRSRAGGSTSTSGNLGGGGPLQASIEDFIKDGHAVAVGYVQATGDVLYDFGDGIGQTITEFLTKGLKSYEERARVLLDPQPINALALAFEASLDELRATMKTGLKPSRFAVDVTEGPPRNTGGTVPISSGSGSGSPGTPTGAINFGFGLPGRARGGPVRRGNAYWVGEEGPEPFVPSQDGRVLSREQAAPTMITQEITINIQGDSDPRRTAEKIVPHLRELMRRGELVR